MKAEKTSDSGTRVVICGSIAHPDLIAAAVAEELNAGRNVVAWPVRDDNTSQTGHALKWREHIRGCHQVVIVGKPDGSIGSSTAEERAFAIDHGKPCRLFDAASSGKDTNGASFTIPEELLTRLLRILNSTPAIPRRTGRRRIDDGTVVIGLWFRLSGRSVPSQAGVGRTTIDKRVNEWKRSGMWPELRAALESATNP